MRVRRVGEHGLLVECADVVEVEGTYAALRARADKLGATDLVPAARTVLLDGLADVERVAALVRGLAPEPPSGAAPDVPAIEIPVSYDGPDLAEVARQWRVEPADVARIHSGTEFSVAFCGFAPGFAYCAGLPDDLVVSRRPEPRARVPAGSVAVAGGFTAVYPAASPGGWQLIGRTDVRVWRPGEAAPALLVPGTRVRFRDVDG
jgi:KipI family sensor histidine kinase inhibitor